MRVRRVVLCLGLSLGVLFPSPSRADEVRWLSVGLRGGTTIVERPVLGGAEDESFQQYDIVSTLGLPWSLYTESGWGVTTQVMGSVGALTGGGDTAFLATLVPGIALGPRNSLFSADIGVGASLLSRHKFGRHDMGGLFQIVLTFGVRVPIYKAIGLGYRFHHMSDAGMYGNGDHAEGVDTHMLELTYTFR
jgi:Lipid A 3-O-deacylase (PagL)